MEHWNYHEEDIYKLVERVQFLQEATYDFDGPHASPRTHLESVDPGGPEEIQWKVLCRKP